MIRDFVGLGSAYEQEIYCALEGFEDETGDLPLHQSGGGAEIRVWSGGAGGVPDVHADAGEFQRLPGALVLRDVEPFPYTA